MPKLIWKDATSYSRDERGFTEPRTLETKAGWLHLGVTRRHGLEGWWGYCRELAITEHRLGVIDLRSAQADWIRWIKERLAMGLKALP